MTAVNQGGKGERGSEVGDNSTSGRGSLKLVMYDHDRPSGNM